MRDLFRSVPVSVGLALALAGSALGGQGRAEPEAQRFYASSYLSVDHWAYDYVNVLVARGKLTGLSPLVQPYRRADVARALLAAEAEGRLNAAEREWVDEMKRELAHEVRLLSGGRSQELRVGAELKGGFKALSHTHRDLLRPGGDESFFLTGELNVAAEAPAVAGVFRGRWDNHFINDPQFANGRAIEFRECDPVIDECAWRIEEAYVEVQSRYARLFFGRTYRNWGLPGALGLLVSNYAYSYDHLGYRFGAGPVALTGLFAPFNDFAGDTARYFSSHRLDWRVRENLVLSASESVIYGGENRRIDFNLTNPVGVWEIGAGPSGSERNSLGLIEVWWRPRQALLTYGAFLVDNTSVGTGGSSALPQYAAAFGVQLPALLPRLALRADFSIANALAYRSRVGRFEFYTIEGLGLARDLTDAIIASVQADWFARRGLVLKPGLQLMWRGEDDIRQPFPEDAFTGRDLLLVGDVEKTVRPSVGGRWHVPRGEVRWDLGLNFIKDQGNVPRDWRVKGVGRIQVNLRQGF